MLVVCWALALALVAAAPAMAEVRVTAPTQGVTGEVYTVTVSGTGPFAARVRFHAQPGTVCDPLSGDQEAVSGPFSHTFTFAEQAPGPWALCARLVGEDDEYDAPGFEQASAIIELRAGVVQLALAPVHPVVGVGEPVRVRVFGQVDTETQLWLWPRPVDGPPCSDAPWIGDQTSGSVSGTAGAIIDLGPIMVPGTYRVCARPRQAEELALLETQVTVSQACADAHRARTLRTASYRRARGAYRRARGARRQRLRRAMKRREAAMVRARDQVARDC